MEKIRIRQPFLFEALLKWLWDKIKEFKVPLTASAVVGLLCYAFALTNKIINHDDVSSLFNKGGTFGLGRWGLGYTELLFPNYSMPWINGVLAILLVAAATCVILRCFQIRSKLLQALLAGVIMACPTLIGTMSYMYAVAPYMLSLLLAVISVWLMEQPGKWRFPAALVCLVVSLSMYQAYVAVAASLLVLLLIQKLLHGGDVLDVIRKGVKALLFLGLALGIYYGLTQVINQAAGIEFGGYAQERMGFELSELPGRVILAYEQFLRIFWNLYFGLVPNLFSRTLHLVCIAATGVLGLIWLWLEGRRDWKRTVLLAVLLALLPLAINAMYLIIAADGIHTLILYSFAAVYLLFAVVAEACLSLPEMHKAAARLGTAAIHVITGCLALIIAVNIYTANIVYLNQYLCYEITYSFYTSLAADIKMTPGFDEDTHVAVIGDYEYPEFYGNFKPYVRIAGVGGFLPGHYSKYGFMEYYLDFPVQVPSDAEVAQIAASEEFAQMPVYPYYGSMKMIGDVLVVKLS